MRRSALACCVAACVAGSALVPSEAAATEMIVEAQPHASLLLADGSGGPLAGGFGGRLSLGITPELYPLLVVGNAGAELLAFGDDAGRTVARFFVGGRFGITWVVEPSIYLNAGYGLARGEVAGVSLSEDGFSLATGFGLDYRPSRSFTIGPRLGYAMLAASRTSHWLDLGLSGAYLF